MPRAAGCCDGQMVACKYLFFCCSVFHPWTHSQMFRDWLDDFLPVTNEEPLHQIIQPLCFDRTQVLLCTGKTLLGVECSLD